VKLSGSTGANFSGKQTLKCDQYQSASLGLINKPFTLFLIAFLDLSGSQYELKIITRAIINSIPRSYKTI
jgi:hypothetical protein